MMNVIGHRGASGDFAENTLLAFRGARAQGADWVELDVRRTSDGVLVVHHDPSISGGDVIAHTEYDALPDTVPTLAEALQASAPMGVNVEIKNSPGEAGHDPSGELARLTIDVIARSAGASEILVSSFDLDTLVVVRSISGAPPTGYLVLSADDPLDAVAAAVVGGHRAINPWDPFVTADSVKRSHAAGIEVNVWTVDDPDRIRQLAAWGVDSVITNRPAVALEALGRG